MAITYNAGTNLITVDAYSAETPATFDDIVTADRAGTYELLAVWNPNNSTKVLDNQIKPVELRGLLIDFVVANKSADADYIFITGTDSWGNALTESLNVSAGDDTYTTTEHFRTITNVDCTDNPAGGGTLWNDGDVTVNQGQWGVIWDYGEKNYLLDASLEIGDGSDAYFTTKGEQITFNNRLKLRSLANAVFTIGTKVSTDTVLNGSSIFFRFDSGDAGASWKNWHVFAGVCNFYGARFQTTGTKTSYFGWMKWQGADELIRNNFYRIDGFEIQHNDAVINHFTSMGLTFGFTPGSNATISDFILNGGGTGLNLHWNAVGAIVNDASFQDNIKDLALEKVYPCYLRNSSYSVVGWVGNTFQDILYDQKSVNIHVVDSSGANIETATVYCTDVTGGEVLDVTTDANGDITEAWITYRELFQPQIVESRSPHIFTISKAGYRTQKIIYNFADGKVDWEIELAKGDTVIYDSTIYDSTIY